MNWQALRSLHALYQTGNIKSTPALISNAVIKYHVNQTKELLITRKEIITKDKPSFQNTFVKLYLQKYNDCLALLNDIDENTPQCRFYIDDILRLKEMKQQMDNGDLQNIRQQIINAKETRRGVSLMFFKNEKHLDSSQALERAVKKILDIELFVDNRDFQYLYVLQCRHPRAIVLCENLHFLKMPGVSRENNIELWYAGGRNIEKLQYADRKNLPIYYMCDWDYDGLDIYRLVKEKIPEIKLLTPNGSGRDINLTEHRSTWKYCDDTSRISGLPINLFSHKQMQLIESLIERNEWIIEESNNLIAILHEVD